MNKLESQLLDLLIEDEDFTSILREQLNGAEISEREFSGAGFFSTIKPNAKAPPIPGREDEKERIILDGALIESPDLPCGGEAILFVQNGKIDFLEVYSFDSHWPNGELRHFTLKKNWKSEQGGAGQRRERAVPDLDVIRQNKLKKKWPYS